MSLGQEIAVGMAEIKVGRDPQVLTTVLGSCVGVCLYSPQHKVGGLLHFMMPTSKYAAQAGEIRKAKYADTGVAELLHLMHTTYGVKLFELEAKIFGGAKVLPNMGRNIGDENIEAVKSHLASKSVAIKALCVGGEKGYRIKFNLQTGVINCQIFGNQPEEF